MINKQNNDFGNSAVGINSTTVGYCTQTTNYGEFAAGILNKSTRGENPNNSESVIKDKNATLFSVGCGDHTERKNAFEVKGDGSVNISGIGNLQEELKKLANVHDEILLKKDPNNQLQYTLYVGDKNCGEINIPKDQFLKNVEYNDADKKLIFTFVTTDDDNVVTEISVADLVDTYKAGDNVTIKDNTISVDFSPITTVLNTKVDKSDFDYVVKVNDDNKGNVINARQVMNNQTTGISNNYDLILGEQSYSKDGESVPDSYIKIDSTKSNSSVSTRDKLGDILVNSAHSINLEALGHINIKTRSNITFTGWSLFYNHIGLFNTTDSDSICLSIWPSEFKFLGSTKRDAEIESLIKAEDGTNVVEPAELSVKLVHFNDDTSSFSVTKNKIKAWSDTMQMEKGKNIKFKTSSSNTMRLTEGEGFKVFANMYAEPDHATDIAEYSDEEKAILSSDTIQKIILDLRKRILELEAKVAALQSSES